MFLRTAGDVLLSVWHMVLQHVNNIGKYCAEVLTFSCVIVSHQNTVKPATRAEVTWCNALGAGARPLWARRQSAVVESSPYDSGEASGQDGLTSYWWGLSISSPVCLSCLLGMFQGISPVS